jgi:hypothetical protein
VFLARQGSQVTVGTATWPEYGARGVATCGGRRANGGAWVARRGKRVSTTWLG